MNSSRSVVLGAAVLVGGLLASTVATRLLLYWLPELFASTALFPASALFRALPIPIMVGLTLFAVLTAFRSVLGRDDTRRAATDAPIYFFGLTILYVTFALAVPLFEIWHYEPAIYGPVAIILLVTALRRSATRPSGHGAPEDSQPTERARPERTIVLSALAAAMSVGSSVAYGRELLAESTTDCATSYCSTELTITILAVMVVGATVASGMAIRGAQRQGDVERLTITLVTAFACLSLLTAPIVVFRLVPYYYYVPGLFYGLSALALLTSASTNPDLTEAPQPRPTTPPAAGHTDIGGGKVAGLKRTTYSTSLSEPSGSTNSGGPSRATSLRCFLRSPVM